MLRAARELLAVRSPLDAELMVSELLGTWWGQRPLRPGTRAARRRRADVEEIVGEGLVAYAAQQGTPAALALLSGIACLGTPRQATSAEQAALALMERGVARPGWAEHVGAVAAAECYLNSDSYGDRDEVVCVFSYAGQEQHALVAVVDYNAGGLARDGWVTSQVTKLLDYCGQSASSFTQVPPSHARRLLESALTVTERAADPPVSSSFPSYHAFIRARVRTLPPARSADIPPPGAAQAGSTAARPQTWRKDRRAMLVAEFLASDEAENLSDRESASRCADHIVDYGCDQDFGRPLRMSPAKVETFLLDWLPRKVMLSSAAQHAMPHVLAAWVRWPASARAGMPRRSGPRWTRCSTRWARSPASTTIPPRSAWSRASWPGCCPIPTWRRWPAGSSRSASCRAATGAPTWARSTRPGRRTAGSCWPRTTTARPAGPAATSTSTGTWRWPTGCGAATRRSSGRPRSACSTSARTGTRCCTR